jgi:hypothetical protein
MMTVGEYPLQYGAIKWMYRFFDLQTNLEIDMRSSLAEETENFGLKALHLPSISTNKHSPNHKHLHLKQCQALLQILG